MQETQEISVGKILWRRKWQPTPVFLPRESHGQRSLMGYSPWDRKEADTAEGLNHHQTTAGGFLCGHTFSTPLGKFQGLVGGWSVGLH